MSASLIPEPSFNLKLTEVLQRKHPDWPKQLVAENTGVISGGKGKRPDIILNAPGGVPVVVETEFMPARTVEADARGRLGETLSADGRPIEQTIAVRMPHGLRNHRPDKELVAAIGEAAFEYCLFSLVRGDNGEDRTVRWPGTGWIEGGVDDLATCIELTALSENRMAEGLDVLERGISQAAERLRTQCAGTPDLLERIAADLHQEDSEQTSRMAMAIVVNALTFHRAIVGTKSADGAFTVKTIDELRGGRSWLPKTHLLQHWEEILERINYWPIFRIAADVLTPIPNGAAQAVIDRLEEVSADLARLGVTSQNDLGGRMFQRLIADRKFLATFYTLPSSAALLADLAIARLDVDWADPEALRNLRIADFACGTGALLSAAYHTVLARHRRTGGNDRELHAGMMEKVLVGTDIMPAAAHLTASMLSSAHPREPFLDTSIVTLPYGRQPGSSIRHAGLGALDLIRFERTLPLFGTGRKQKGTRKSRDEHLDMPHGGFDLVIMNPPFTRPTNHEASDVPVPSFAGFGNSETEQKEMSARLRSLRRPGAMAGHGNAGLASNFIDIAHAKVKPGGVIALVLPASFLQGEAWDPARRLLQDHYREITAVSITATGSTDRAFSADTGMAEVLIVATRRSSKSTDAAPALFVNLRSRPTSILAAAATGTAVRRIPADGEPGPLTVGADASDAGCHIPGLLSSAGAAGVRATDVGNAATGLMQGQLRLPDRKRAVLLPLTTLGDLGRRGLLDRDISGTETNKAGQPRGPFAIGKIQPGEIPTYPTLWGHDAKRERRMVVLPPEAARVREGCQDRAVDVWQETASRLHFNRDFRLNSQPLTACLTPDPSIGGRAWPNFLCTDRRWEIPLVLWANTTLGLIAFWWIGTRQQEGRAVLTISKLPALTVLDPRLLTPLQLERAAAIFGDFEAADMLPANEAWQDDARKLLDRAVLIDLLELPEDIVVPLDRLRLQWCAEPSVHGGKSTRPPVGVLLSSRGPDP